MGFLIILFFLFQATRRFKLSHEVLLSSASGSSLKAISEDFMFSWAKGLIVAMVAFTRIRLHATIDTRGGVRFRRTAMPVSLKEQLDVLGSLGSFADFSQFIADAC